MLTISYWNVHIFDKPSNSYVHKNLPCVPLKGSQQGASSGVEKLDELVFCASHKQFSIPSVASTVGNIFEPTHCS